MTPSGGVVNECCPNDCDGSFVKAYSASVVGQGGYKVSAKADWMPPLLKLVLPFKKRIKTGFSYPTANCGYFPQTQDVLLHQWVYEIYVDGFLGISLDVPLNAKITGSYKGVSDARCPSYCFDISAEAGITPITVFAGGIVTGYVDKVLLRCIVPGTDVNNAQGWAVCTRINKAELNLNAGGTLKSGIKAVVGWRTGDLCESQGGYGKLFCFEDVTGKVTISGSVSWGSWHYSMNQDLLTGTIIKGNCP